MRSHKLRLFVCVLVCAICLLVGCGSRKQSPTGDGTYLMEVNMKGGSGRASIASPTKVFLRNGDATAIIEWSSPNYDYMVVDDKRFLPMDDGGNSTFEIPVKAFDEPIEVIGDTTAMSQPHEITYTLTFDSSTAQRL